jgi:hypothetical protein
MKLASILLSVLVLAACTRKEAKRDRERLDAQLATVRIDRVKFVSVGSSFTTNIVSGAEAQQMLASLAATNRTSGTELKDEVRISRFI